jgi:hypothetical protein
MWAHAFPHLLSNVLAAIFAVSAMVDLAGFRFVRARFRQWRYPRQFYRVVGVLQLVTAVFLATPLLRVWGIILAGLITFFSVVTLLNHRQWIWAIAGILIMMALVPASLASQ